MVPPPPRTGSASSVLSLSELPLAGAGGGRYCWTSGVSLCTPNTTQRIWSPSVSPLVPPATPLQPVALALAPAAPVVLAPAVPVALAPAAPVALAPAVPVALAPAAPVVLAMAAAVALAMAAALALTPATPVAVAPATPVVLGFATGAATMFTPALGFGFGFGMRSPRVLMWTSKHITVRCWQLCSAALSPDTGGTLPPV